MAIFGADVCWGDGWWEAGFGGMKLGGFPGPAYFSRLRCYWVLALVVRERCGVLALILKLRELVAERCRFVGVFRGLKMEFPGADGSYGFEHLADNILLALVHRFELNGDVFL